MKRKEVKQAIKVLQAWLDGAAIEERPNWDRKWCAFTDTMYFEFGHNFEYRIKPKPREFWLWDSPSIFPTGSGTVSWSDSKPRHIDNPIKVREVL